MQTFSQDLGYGARILMKQPGFTLIAVLTLALGISAHTAIFSVAGHQTENETRAHRRSGGAAGGCGLNLADA